MKAGVVVFPGTNCDRDTLEACEAFGWDAEYVWHDDIRLHQTQDLKQKSRLGLPAQQQNITKVFVATKYQNYLNDFDIIFLPGGFSYGDYIASGRLAKFSPVMDAIKQFVEEKRGIVVGICNGFQILCESGLLPGALTYNERTKFICKNVSLNLHISNPSPLRGEGIFQCEERALEKLGEGDKLILPIAHAEGRYFADEKTIDYIKSEDMIFLTYQDNPNGSVENIAGLYDKKRGIIGMMPHPERAFFKKTAGGTDGQKIFQIIQDRLTFNLLH